VFISMVYHHFPDPVVVAKECCRVLRDSGHVCIRNGTREAAFPHRLRPAMRPVIEWELPVQNDVRVFTAAGLHPSFTRSLLGWWLHPTGRADSFLARLSNADLSLMVGGVNPDDAVTQEIDWFVFTKHLTTRRANFNNLPALARIVSTNALGHCRPSCTIAVIPR
jgi:SAM-dependent methyltransferase